YAHLMDADAIEQFRHEARLVARLEHPHILPLKYADYQDGKFFIVSALGEETLDDRLQRRLVPRTALEYTDQMLSAVSYAHSLKVIHCDIKPDNFLLFPGDHIKLADFGIARVAAHTLQGSGAGTIGYVAPEQAMGSPSLRSDVFSLGVTLFRMFSGVLPTYPYEWPFEGAERLRERVSSDFVLLLRRAMSVDPRKRFRDAVQMKSAYDAMRPRVLTAARSQVVRQRNSRTRDWREVQRREFLRQFGAALEARYACHRCQGPVSEAMIGCPWCGTERTRHRGGTRFPQQCPRCERGLKLDWNYCAWCYGSGFEASDRRYSDVRYTAKCPNVRCGRRELMPFMRYCPWCQTKVKRKWPLPGSKEKCRSCGWGVAGEFWSYCPWCTKALIASR